MATAKSIQRAEILSIQGSSIRIKHPDLSERTKTSIISPFSVGGTALSVRDNHGFADDDWMILGNPGSSKTEEIDVSAAVTRGTAITVTISTTKFSHEIDTPVYKVLERGIKIYGAATDGGSGTLIASIDALTTPIADAAMIQWSKPWTEYTLISTDTAYAYYYVQFTDGTTVGAASDYVIAAGQPYNSGKSVVESALKLARAEVDGQLISWDYLLELVNDWQDTVSHYVLPDGTVKDWPFEEFEELTSLTTTQNENAYAVSSLTADLKYPDSKQGIIQMKLGADDLEYVDLDEYERQMNGNVRTEVQTQAAIGATSLVLDDTSELGDDGSIYVGTQSAVITYTTKDDATDTISGIPASGTGSITATATVDAVVWQNIAPGTPKQYTMFNGEILLPIPPDSDSAGLHIKVKGYKALDRVDSLSDISPIPFPHIAKYFLASEIEYRKKNSDNGDRFAQKFAARLAEEARRNMGHLAESQSYYNFYTSDRAT